MNEFLVEFRTTIESASERLLDLPEVETEAALNGGWCAKQILGHLIDSAANNHSRFVRAQLQDDLLFDGYDGEAWVRVEKYEQESWASLVDLWTNYNLHLLHVISNIPDETLQKPRTKHSLDKIAWQTVPANEPVTLDYFIRDYLGHLQDHLKQIFDESVSR
jgi:hypothetical protein